MRLLVQGLGPAFFVSLDGATVRELRARIHAASGIPAAELRLRSSGRELRDDALIDDACAVLASLRLEGGKGGFGSLLRSGQPGVRVRKVGNDACRDLETGKRMRVVSNERRLADWQTTEKEREMLLEQEKERIRKEKEDAKPKFDDVKYSAQLTEIRESVVAAVQDGVKVALQKQKEEAERKLKVEQAAPAIHPPSKRHGLWNEFDDLPLSDEDAPAPAPAAAAASAKRPAAAEKDAGKKKSKKANGNGNGHAAEKEKKESKAEGKAELSGFLVAKPKKLPPPDLSEAKKSV